MRENVCWCCGKVTQVKGNFNQAREITLCSRTCKRKRKSWLQAQARREAVLTERALEQMQAIKRRKKSKAKTCMTRDQH